MRIRKAVTASSRWRLFRIEKGRQGDHRAAYSATAGTAPVPLPSSPKIEPISLMISDRRTRALAARLMINCRSGCGILARASSSLPVSSDVPATRSRSAPSAFARVASRAMERPDSPVLEAVSVTKDAKLASL